MQIPRKILILLFTTALLVVGVAASIALLYPQLPDPRTADREDLLRWLVSRDLRRESMETRHALACRFEEEFCTACNTKADPDWESVEKRLDQSQRQQLWDNLPVVLEPWFLEKTDRYSELPQADRTAYLDRMLDMVAALSGIAVIRPSGNEAEDPSAAGGLQALLLGQVEQWKQKAEPPQREKIDRFLADMQMRLLLRMWESSTTPG